MNAKIKEEGEAALFETGVGPVDPKLTHLLGRLAFELVLGKIFASFRGDDSHCWYVGFRIRRGCLSRQERRFVPRYRQGALDHEVKALMWKSAERFCKNSIWICG